MLRCVNVPDLARLIGRPVALHPRSRGKGELVEPQYVFGAVARATVTVITEPRGAVQATSLRDAANHRFNPSKNQKEKEKNQRVRS